MCAMKFGRMVAFVSLSALVFLSGCGPAKKEKSEEIKPNETAFVIPLETDTKDGQAKFHSIEFLERSKVASKRVVLDQRTMSTGRWWFDYEWIPTVLVVRVDRAPVTREWTEDPTKGTSAKSEAIEVESLDSINFAVGITGTASIHEENTARFLYFYAGKQLSEIMDTNVRGYLQMALAREFGKVSLTDGMAKKSEILAAVAKETQEFFETKGVSIEYVGNTGGLRYTNPNIQKAIDQKFVAEQDKQTALQEQTAQVTRNAILVARAKAESDAAKELANASEAVQMKVDLEIRKIQAEAMKAAAEKWNGSMPANIMPQGTSLLFGLDQAKK